MKLQNLSETDLRITSGGTEESYNLGKEFGRLLREMGTGLKGIF